MSGSGTTGDSVMRVVDAELLPDRSGALVWPARNLLVFSDLHLEKASSFARRGYLLPPYDSTETLRRMREAMERIDPRQVICLGDSFHDAEAADRMSADDRAALARLMQDRHWTWITGNHDPTPPQWLGGEVADELDLAPLHFRHEPRTGPAAGEVCGHLHPKASIAPSGRRITRRCFATDGRRLVLPAFGAYTGGLDVRDQAFARLFPDRLDAWLLGRRGSHRISVRNPRREETDPELNQQPYLPDLFQEKNLKYDPNY